jgi:hypothetical protein
MNTNADPACADVAEAAEIISELVTHPVVDWRRIGALAERVQKIANEKSRLD